MSDNNINSPFNACSNQEYCKQLLAMLELAKEHIFMFEGASEVFLKIEAILDVREEKALDYDCERHGKGRGADCPTCFDSDEKTRGRYVP